MFVPEAMAGCGADPPETRARACGRAAVAAQPRLKSLRTQPLLAAGSLAWPAQRWEAGTPAITCLTCWPQPAQVVLPHFLQVTARHTMVLLNGGGVSCGEWLAVR